MLLKLLGKYRQSKFPEEFKALTKYEKEYNGEPPEKVNHLGFIKFLRKKEFIKPCTSTFRSVLGEGKCVLRHYTMTSKGVERINFLRPEFCYLKWY